jgi:drug/metabolite transporter (DMT)-like permease
MSSTPDSATSPQAGGGDSEPPPWDTTAHMRPVTVSAALLATRCAALWGGLAVAVRFTQDDIPPLATAGLRFGIATLLLAGTILGQGASLGIDRKQFLAVLPVGLLLFSQIGSYHFGQAYTSSAHGSVIIGSYPVFVALVAHFLLQGDRVSPGKLAGLVVAFGGLLSIVAGARSPTGTSTATRDAATLYGDGIILVSSMLIGVNTVMSKRALTLVAVPKLLFWSNVIATGLFFATSFTIEGDVPWRFSPAAAWGLAYQSVVVAWICFLIWTGLLRHHRASHIAVFGFAQPLCGMFFGVWLRGDPMTASLAMGAAAVATGIVLVTRAEG